VTVLVVQVCLGPVMHPVPRGTSADFWRMVADVDIGGTRGLGIAAVVLHDERFVYVSGGMEDVWAYWIPESEAMANWPAAQAALDMRLATAATDDCVASGYRRWKAIPVNERMGIVGLNEAVCAASCAQFERDLPRYLRRERYFAYLRQMAECCVKKMDWYWATFCFEFLFLGALIWWIAWPVIKGSGVLRYVMHWGLAPALFFLPSWLGYAVPRLHVLETGGILYSRLLWFSLRPAHNAAWEAAFLRCLPPILEPLSQQTPFAPWEPGSWASIGWTMHGPISAMVAGGAAAILIFIVLGADKYVFKPWRQKYRPQGFEVVMDAPRGNE